MITVGPRSRRYDRQSVLPEVGAEGQARISRARVLCVGAGGLGSPAALYLAAAGVGTLGLIDPDRVDESNLQRQVLFGTHDLGKLKVDAARERLTDLNPLISIEVHAEALGAKNALEVLNQYDVILDGTDNFAAKFLINDAAVKLGLPVVYGSISQFEGRVAVFWAKHGPCYRCLHQELPKAAVQNCAEAGVIGAVAGIIGSMQALEALKIILHTEGRATGLEPLLGRINVFDGATLQMFGYEVDKKPDCSVCSIAPDSVELSEISLTCGSPGDEISESALGVMRQAMSCTLVDVREDDEWTRGHIEGAIHWPLSRMERGLFPDSRNLAGECVLYCQTGTRSLRALVLLRESGLGSLKSLRGGFSSWSGSVTQGRNP